MTQYEYEVVPAPRKGKKAKGIKGSDGRFAHAMTELLNDMATEGWEYQRTDTLPSEERSGFTGRTTVYQNLLVFRRPLADVEDVAAVASPKIDSIPTVEEPEQERQNAPRLPSAEDANAVGDHAPAVDLQKA